MYALLKRRQRSAIVSVSEVINLNLVALKMISVVKKTLSLFRRILFRLALLKRRDCILLQTPSHSNIGDSEIALAERRFLKKRRISFFEITFDEYRENRGFIIRHQNAFTFIALHGGGNVGNEYLNEEEMRRDILDSFKDKRIIIFPQTIFFSPDETGEFEKAKTIAVYNSAKGLIICCRDRRSYNFAQSFLKCEAHLVPDIVLSVPKKSQNASKNGKVLFILRADNEKIVREDQVERVKNLLVDLGVPYDVSDMMAKKDIRKSQRGKICKKKLKQIADYSLVITDRLHGMVFSYLANTPCIAVDNYNGKVSGTFEWIQDSKMVSFAKDLSDINASLITDQMSASGDSFEFDETHYSVLFSLLNTLKE